MAEPAVLKHNDANIL